MPTKKKTTPPKKTSLLKKRSPVTAGKPTAPKIDSQKGFYIVGIGASAGGLNAFEQFFENMPNDPGVAFVLVPHLDPTHISLMPELIQKRTRMPVVQAKDGIRVLPNTVHIVPPNHELVMLNGTLQLMEPSKGAAPRMPIDYFFRSLAQDRRDKAVCIVLSGMGSDGTLGFRAIKGEMGMSMVQSPESAGYESMLRECTETLGVHHGIQIFATDIDETAVETARQGVYPASIAADVGPELFAPFWINRDERI